MGATVDVRQGSNGTYAVLLGKDQVHTTDGPGADARAYGFAAWLRQHAGDEGPRGRCCLGEACDRDRIPSQCLAFVPPLVVARVQLCPGHRRVLAGDVRAEGLAGKARGPGAPPPEEPKPGPARGRVRRGKAGAS